ncbi:SDR family NAD(P)-dependent oxidoreductase [Vibrio sp. SS-MA-C1-2]|uniref:SDR family NAD(P)-dependent oxidoreductase n=1 Tax=Vibrio sp. SS-MA-C1-2 TaxID=2908646 RepID=UPI001F1E7C94|nr:SDR family NAD(P)-dependent oxidoreductase [Vibrio sp. SS-MA-C1-2]UJF17330.1 SDR family NAD(P)-dependent oxidoreductase [Vibrio sp. SS-MA-C1-2]
MNNIAIFGAGSGLGAAMVEHFFNQGYRVIAVTRTPNNNLFINNPFINEYQIESIVCDATDPQQVNDAVKTLPENCWVISTMGSFGADIPVDYLGHRYLIDELEKRDIVRFLLITSLGCGDSWRYLSERSKLGFGSAVREKSLAEAWLQSSRLDYTILRPGGLKDGEATLTGVISQHKEVHGVIHRNEVARLTEQLLKNYQTIGQIYQCVDPTLVY